MRIFALQSVLIALSIGAFWFAGEMGIISLFRQRVRKRHLFVCGCPRSGTTALQLLLVSHPRIVLGAERYSTLARKGKGLHPGLFTKKRFFDIRPRDTFYDAAKYRSYYDELEPRFDDAAWVGDKAPWLFYSLGYINRTFPSAHIIVIVRRDPQHVASSFQVRARNGDDTWASSRDYKLAVEQWNAAAERTLAFVEKRSRRASITVVEYSELFGESADIDELFGCLDLEVTPDVRKAYDGALETANALNQRRQSALSEQEADYVRANAATETVDRLLGHRLRIASPREAIGARKLRSSQPLIPPNALPARSLGR
jgi:sulfotransferase family protein